MEISHLRDIGLLSAGTIATVYYAFSIVTTTMANWRIFRTLPVELRKQTVLLEKILERLEK
jgi:hypothetical protein